MKFASRLTTSLAAVVAMALAGQASAALIDDFSDTDLSEYTATVILDTDAGNGANTAVWQSPSGALQYDTTTWLNIEQAAFIRDGLSLGVGQEVQVDISHTAASQDIGLYVGGTAPSFNVRQDYVAVYARGDGNLYSRGFDGTTEYGLEGAGVVSYDSLFIARTAANTFETGYYDGATRNVISTRTPTTPNAATYVGFYTDVRAAGTLGNADNLRIVPEPAALALAGLAVAGAVALRRRK